MKIIFNYKIDDWKGQIYQELQKSFDVVVPHNFTLNNPSPRLGDSPNFDFESLRQCVANNPDSAFIFSFFGDIRQLIQWHQLHLDIPIIDFRENALNRPYIGLRTAFVNLWYDERFAQPLLYRFNRENLVFAGMAANPDIFHPLTIEKKYDVSFIGQPYGERGYYLKKLHKFALKQNILAYFPRAHGAKFILTYERINEIYNQSKINIAFAPKEQPGRIINLRSYEICMSGNFQLVQYTPCLEEFFEFGTEIVGWTTTRDLFKKIRYYLDNPDERERIAKKGYERAIKNHTWTHRFAQVAAFLENKKRQNFSKTLAENTFNLLNESLPSQINLQRNVPQISLNLKKLGYNLKRDLKKKSSIKISDDNSIFLYKADLQNFWFIELKKKIMMILYVLPKEHQINVSDWEYLVRIRSLILNFDLSTPPIGLISNTNQNLCYDFQNNQWLKKIPAKKGLLSRITSTNWFVTTLLIVAFNCFKKMKGPIHSFLKRVRNKIRYILRFRNWNQSNFLKIDWNSIWVQLFGI